MYCAGREKMYDALVAFARKSQFEDPVAYVNSIDRGARAPLITLNWLCGTWGCTWAADTWGCTAL